MKALRTRASALALAMAVGFGGLLFGGQQAEAKAGPKATVETLAKAADATQFKHLKSGTLVHPVDGATLRVRAGQSEQSRVDAYNRAMGYKTAAAPKPAAAPSGATGKPMVILPPVPDDSGTSETKAEAKPKKTTTRVILPIVADGSLGQWFDAVTGNGPKKPSPTLEHAFNNCNSGHTQLAVFGSDGRLETSMGGMNTYPMYSVTKLLVLHLYLDALKDGTVTGNERIEFSAFAASQPAYKKGVREGQKMPLSQAVREMMIYSHNDVAAGVAEHIARAYHPNVANPHLKAVEMMNARLRAAGATQARIVTVHGAPLYERSAGEPEVVNKYYNYWGVTSAENYLRHLKSQHSTVAEYLNPKSDMPGKTGTGAAFGKTERNFSGFGAGGRTLHLAGVPKDCFGALVSAVSDSFNDRAAEAPKKYHERRAAKQRIKKTGNGKPQPRKATTQHRIAMR